MKLLFVVSHPESGPVFCAITSACERLGQSWACFFTDDGVRVLGDARARELACRAQPATVCGHSWDRFMDGTTCPVAVGSQTELSAMLSKAEKVISL